jgi:hypothetical protein
VIERRKSHDRFLSGRSPSADEPAGHASVTYVPLRA